MSTSVEKEIQGSANFIEKDILMTLTLAEDNVYRFAGTIFPIKIM